MRVRSLLLAWIASCAFLSSGAAHAGTPQWIGAWEAPSDYPGPALKAMTIRQRMRVSAGGSALRVRLSNLFGDKPLRIGPVHVDGAPLAFGGHATVTIPAHGAVSSDPLALPVTPLHELTVSLYLPDGAPVSTLHATGLANAQLAAGPDATAAASLAGAETDDSRYFVAGIEVLNPEGAGTLVTLGDSLTEGAGSTPDTNRRWPDVLAERVQARWPGVGVVNAGIAGNRILASFGDGFIGPSTLERFDRDVLEQPNVRWVLFLQGINDIMGADGATDPARQVSAQQLIAAIEQLAARAHAKGVAFWVGTVLPRGGSQAFRPHTAAAEAKRQALNAWIRSTRAIDGVIDYDAAVRDPAHPDRLLPAYAAKDLTHLNDMGNRKMAETVDLDRVLGGVATTKR
ncbi:MAG: SGNH/GDSL hydrolase family protein [Telluria sp.]